MSTNKSISYLLFLSSHFSFQPNKRVFHHPTFSSLQPNTHEGKPNIFHSLTFPSSHFSTLPTKRTLTVNVSQVFGHCLELPKTLES